MSNHFSAANLRFPGNDRRLDLTDVFAFASSQDPDKTVLIINSNPTSAPPPIEAQARGPEFYPGAVYRINVDTDGDAYADVARTARRRQWPVVPVRQVSSARRPDRGLGRSRASDAEARQIGGE